jgi:hypothetical protein
MRQFCLAAALLTSTIVCASAAFAADDPYMSVKGVWTWNEQASIHSIMAMGYKSATLEYTKDDGTNFAFKQTAIKKDGSTEIDEFEGAFDGQPRRDMNTMIRYWRLSNSSFSLRYDGTGIRGQEAIAVGKDRITITGSLTDAKGNSTPYIDIWDRVK